jgi:hypothetical protein
MKKFIAMLSMGVVAATSFGQSSILEKIGVEILSDRFGINTRDILGIQRDRDDDIWDLGPTLSMSRYGRASASDVQRMRASGMGWGEIAHRIGMHPGTFNKLRKQGYFDRDPFWDDVIRRRYGTRQEDIDLIRRRGGGIDDILGSVIVGKASSRRPTEVFDRYRSDKSWDKTADRYRFDFGNWERHGKKVGWDGGTSSPGTVKKATATTKSKGKSTGDSGNAKGKSGDKGQGKGNSKGKGKGKGGGDF